MTARSTVAGAAAGKHAERAPGTGRFTKKAPPADPAGGSGEPPTPPAPKGGATPPPAPSRSLAARVLRGSLGDVIRGR